MTKLADTQKALAELYEWVQWYLEDSDAPYPIGEYLTDPAIKKAAGDAYRRFGDFETLTAEMQGRRTAPRHLVALGGGS